MQSVNSFRSELASPSIGPLNSTMASSVHSASPPQDPFEIDRLITAIRQLTEDKEDLTSQVDSISKQLEEVHLLLLVTAIRKTYCVLYKEREHVKKDREQMEEERRRYQEQSADLERRLELAQKQVSPQTLESLRNAEALGRKMLAVRDGEVQLLKAQLVSTEAKVDALKERHELQKVVVLGEVRKMANQLALTEFQLKKWKELAVEWSQTIHADDIKLESTKELDGAEELGKKLQELLSVQLSAAKELDAVKEANMSLVRALAQHGHRLSTVTNQLDQTWVWLSKIKLQASQLQTDESVNRYDLKEKRELINSLKEQLEVSKQQWERIRHQNDANQEQWQSIRDELDERKMLEGTPLTPSDEESEQDVAGASKSEEREQPAFIPPIDLVSDIVENHVTDDEIPTEARDGREERLQLMEQQCRSLYSKLVNSTSRNAALVSRLANLHQHYSIKEQPSTPTDPTAPENLMTKVGDQVSSAWSALVLHPPSNLL